MWTTLDKQVRPIIVVVHDEAKYVSPDGALTFLVVRETRDVALGFEGVPSHTHATILAELYDLPAEAAIARYLARLLENKSIVAIATVNGKIRDIWVVDQLPPERDKYKPEDEVITFRFWDGTPYRVSGYSGYSRVTA